MRRSGRFDRGADLWLEGNVGVRLMDAAYLSDEDDVSFLETDDVHWQELGVLHKPKRRS